MINRFHISEPQLLRLIVIVLFSLFVSVYLPPVVFGDVPTLTNPTTVIIIFVFLAGFLISNAMQRNRNLDSAVSVEVSRLRRIVHLVQRMQVTPKEKQIVHRGVIEYLRKVATNDFREYDKGHASLKGVTRTLYTMKPKNQRDLVVYSEILENARDAAYQRQQVAHLVRSYASAYIWLILVVVVAISVILLLASREAHFTSQFFIAGSIAGLLLILDILYEQDNLTLEKRRWYQARYAGSAMDLKKEYGNGNGKRPAK